MEVLAWSHTASMFIANARFYGSDSDKAIACVHQLTLLARKALESPDTDQLQQSIKNDPYTHAAYSYGRQHGYQDAQREFFGEEYR